MSTPSETESGNFDINSVCKRCAADDHWSKECRNKRVFFCWICGRKNIRTTNCCSAPKEQDASNSSSTKGIPYPKEPIYFDSKKGLCATVGFGYDLALAKIDTSSFRSFVGELYANELGTSSNISKTNVFLKMPDGSEKFFNEELRTKMKFANWQGYMNFLINDDLKGYIVLGLDFLTLTSTKFITCGVSITLSETVSVSHQTPVIAESISEKNVKSVATSMSPIPTQLSEHMDVDNQHQQEIHHNVSVFDSRQHNNAWETAQTHYWSAGYPSSVVSDSSFVSSEEHYRVQQTNQNHTVSPSVEKPRPDPNFKRYTLGPHQWTADLTALIRQRQTYHQEDARNRMKFTHILDGVSYRIILAKTTSDATVRVLGPVIYGSTAGNGCSNNSSLVHSPSKNLSHELPTQVSTTPNAQEQFFEKSFDTTFGRYTVEPADWPSELRSIIDQAKILHVENARKKKKFTRVVNGISYSITLKNNTSDVLVECLGPTTYFPIRNDNDDSILTSATQSTDLTQCIDMDLETDDEAQPDTEQNKDSIAFIEHNKETARLNEPLNELPRLETEDISSDDEEYPTENHKTNELSSISSENANELSPISSESELDEYNDLILKDAPETLSTYKDTRKRKISVNELESLGSQHKAPRIMASSKATVKFSESSHDATPVILSDDKRFNKTSNEKAKITAKSITTRDESGMHIRSLDAENLVGKTSILVGQDKKQNKTSNGRKKSIDDEHQTNKLTVEKQNSTVETSISICGINQLKDVSSERNNSSIKAPIPQKPLSNLPDKEELNKMSTIRENSAVQTLEVNVDKNKVNEFSNGKDMSAGAAVVHCEKYLTNKSSIVCEKSVDGSSFVLEKVINKNNSVVKNQLNKTALGLQSQAAEHPFAVKDVLTDERQSAVQSSDTLINNNAEKSTGALNVLFDTNNIVKTSNLCEASANKSLVVPCDDQPINKTSIATRISEDVGDMFTVCDENHINKVSTVLEESVEESLAVSGDNSEKNKKSCCEDKPMTEASFILSGGAEAIVKHTNENISTTDSLFRDFDETAHIKRPIANRNLSANETPMVLEHEKEAVELSKDKEQNASVISDKNYTNETSIVCGKSVELCDENHTNNTSTVMQDSIEKSSYVLCDRSEGNRTSSNEEKSVTQPSFLLSGGAEVIKISADKDLSAADPLLFNFDEEASAANKKLAPIETSMNESEIQTDKEEIGSLVSNDDNSPKASTSKKSKKSHMDENNAFEILKKLRTEMPKLPFAKGLSITIAEPHHRTQEPSPRNKVTLKRLNAEKPQISDEKDGSDENASNASKPKTVSIPPTKLLDDSDDSDCVLVIDEPHLETICISDDEDNDNICTDNNIQRKPKASSIRTFMPPEKYPADIIQFVDNVSKATHWKKPTKLFLRESSGIHYFIKVRKHPPGAEVFTEEVYTDDMKDEDERKKKGTRKLGAATTTSRRKSKATDTKTETPSKEDQNTSSKIDEQQISGSDMISTEKETGNKKHKAGDVKAKVREKQPISTITNIAAQDETEKRLITTEEQPAELRELMQEIRRNWTGLEKEKSFMRVFNGIAYFVQLHKGKGEEVYAKQWLQSNTCKPKPPQQNENQTLSLVAEMVTSPNVSNFEDSNNRKPTLKSTMTGADEVWPHPNSQTKKISVPLSGMTEAICRNCKFSRKIREKYCNKPRFRKAIGDDVYEFEHYNSFYYVRVWRLEYTESNLQTSEENKLNLASAMEVPLIAVKELKFQLIAKEKISLKEADNNLLQKIQTEKQNSTAKFRVFRHVFEENVFLVTMDSGNTNIKVERLLFKSKDRLETETTVKNQQSTENLTPEAIANRIQQMNTALWPFEGAPLAEIPMGLNEIPQQLKETIDCIRKNPTGKEESFRQVIDGVGYAVLIKKSCSLVRVQQFIYPENLNSISWNVVDTQKQQRNEEAEVLTSSSHNEVMCLGGIPKDTVGNPNEETRVDIITENICKAGDEENIKIDESTEIGVTETNVENTESTTLSLFHSDSSASSLRKECVDLSALPQQLREKIELLKRYSNEKQEIFSEYIDEVQYDVNIEDSGKKICVFRYVKTSTFVDSNEAEVERLESTTIASENENVANKPNPVAETEDTANDNDKQMQTIITLENNGEIFRIALEDTMFWAKYNHLVSKEVVLPEKVPEELKNIIKSHNNRTKRKSISFRHAVKEEFYSVIVDKRNLPRIYRLKFLGIILKTTKEENKQTKNNVVVSETESTKSQPITIVTVEYNDEVFHIALEDEEFWFKWKHLVREENLLASEEPPELEHAIDDYRKRAEYKDLSFRLALHGNFYTIKVDQNGAIRKSRLIFSCNILYVTTKDDEKIQPTENKTALNKETFDELTTTSKDTALPDHNPVDKTTNTIESESDFIEEINNFFSSPAIRELLDTYPDNRMDAADAVAQTITEQQRNPTDLSVEQLGSSVNNASAKSLLTKSTDNSEPIQENNSTATDGSAVEKKLDAASEAPTIEHATTSNPGFPSRPLLKIRTPADIAKLESLPFVSGSCARLDPLVVVDKSGVDVLDASFPKQSETVEDMNTSDTGRTLRSQSYLNQKIDDNKIKLNLKSKTK